MGISVWWRKNKRKKEKRKKRKKCMNEIERKNNIKNKKMRNRKCYHNIFTINFKLQIVIS